MKMILTMCAFTMEFLQCVAVNNPYKYSSKIRVMRVMSPLWCYKGSFLFLIKKLQVETNCNLHHTFLPRSGLCWCCRWNMSHRFLSGRNLQSTTHACQSESHLKSMFATQGCWEEPKTQNVKGDVVGFNYSTIFTPIPGKWSNLTVAYFSNGLVQPPTRTPFAGFLLLPLIFIHFPLKFWQGWFIWNEFDGSSLTWGTWIIWVGWKISWQLVLCHW